MLRLVLRLAAVPAVALALVLTASTSRAADAGKRPTPSVQQQVIEVWDRISPLAAIERARERAAVRRAIQSLEVIQFELVNDAAKNPFLTPDGTNNWQFYLLPYLEQQNLYGADYAIPVPGGRLGATVEPVSEALRAQLELPKGKGLLVTDVRGDSAAAKAGVKKFDILLKWDGKEVGDPAAFAKLIDKAPAKKALAASVLRAGKPVDVKEITLPEAGPSSIYLCPSDGTSNTIQINDGSIRYVTPSIDPKLWANVDWGAPIDGNAPKSLAQTTTFRQEDRFTTRYQLD